MYKKTFYIIISIISIAILTYFLYTYFISENNLLSGTTAERLSTEIESDTQSSNNIYNDTKSIVPEETELSSFSTPIKDNASGRLENIRITCNTLNEHIVSDGDTFSFESLVTVTSEKGYQKAKVIENGETIEALGGGNCQVSSTLYNAVLEVPELEVVERHPHGKKVTYVPEGKDAAVSHGSQDFKFKNNTGSDIKLYFSSDDENVYVRIVKLVY